MGAVRAFATENYRELLLQIKRNKIKKWYFSHGLGPTKLMPSRLEPPAQITKQLVAVSSQIKVCFKSFVT